MKTCALLIALTLAACARPGVATVPVPAPGTLIYDGTVAVAPAGGSLSAEWTIRLAARDSVTFLLNEKLRITRITGSTRSARDTIADGNHNITVYLSPGAPEATIGIAYAGKPGFAAENINGIGAEWVELGLDSFWLPVVSDFAHVITGTARITLPAGWQVAAGGDVATSGNTHTLTQRVPLIDIPFAAARGFRVVPSPRASVYHTDAADSVVTRVSTTAQQCGDYLGARYGRPVALPPLRIVLAPRTGPGYARKNYIVITPTAEMSPRALTRFLCHEVAHFWASGAIASGPDNWLNEGFAEFVSARAARELLGRAEYDSLAANWQRTAAGQPAIWTGPAGRRPGPRVSYAKAPYLLHRLEERIGTPVMDTFLRRFLTEPVRTTPAVVALLREVAGDAHAGWFMEELGR